MKRTRHTEGYRLPPYRTILADVPWRYDTWKKTKYPTLSIDTLCPLPIRRIADANSVLFLWATTPLKPLAIHLMSAWGWEYKTCLYWFKEGRRGTGYWYRGEVEELMLGVRGKVKPFRCSEPNWVKSKPREHSRKPEEMWPLIEYGATPPRVELFATEKREGWDCFGLDMNGEDIRDTLARLIKRMEQ